ncbi:hypothetical protein KR009_006909 [Drosophila setifemur]|nr:hypothetical protein KR009_006909 [Drosophila setifemur]
MEATFITAMAISVFCHLMGLFYNPVEASAESTVFVVVTLMFLNKLKQKQGPFFPADRLGQIKEVLALCMAVQILLVVMWFPVVKALQFVVDKTCEILRGSMGEKADWLVDQMQGKTVPLGMIAFESAVLLLGCQMNDVQRFFGCKDDCLSESILSFVKTQEGRVRRRQRKLR